MADLSSGLGASVTLSCKKNASFAPSFLTAPPVLIALLAVGLLPKAPVIVGSGGLSLDWPKC